MDSSGQCPGHLSEHDGGKWFSQFFSMRKHSNGDAPSERSLTSMSFNATPPTASESKMANGVATTLAA